MSENVLRFDTNSDITTVIKTGAGNRFVVVILILFDAFVNNCNLFIFCSIFNDIFLIARLPTTRSNPKTIVNVSIPITAGAATIVDRRSTPVIPNPIAATPTQLSITLITLTPFVIF